MTDQNQYGMEPDDDAEDYSEARVVNVTDEDVTFKVATTAGSKARRYRLAASGQPGDSVHIQSGYTKVYRGAGRKDLAPLIERITMREVYPAGPHGADGKPVYPAGRSLPRVVHEDRADEARRLWQLELAKKDRAIKSSKTVMVGVSLDPMTGAATAATIQADDAGGADPIVASGPPPSSAPKGARGRA